MARAPRRGWRGGRSGGGDWRGGPSGGGGWRGGPSGGGGWRGGPSGGGGWRGGRFGGGSRREIRRVFNVRDNRNRRADAPARMHGREGWSPEEAVEIARRRELLICVYRGCKDILRSKQEMVAHYKERHANKSLPRCCSKCHNRFKDRDVLIRHLEEGHIGRAPTGAAIKLYGRLLSRMSLNEDQLYWLRFGRELIYTPSPSPSLLSSSSESSSSSSSEPSSSQ